MHTGVAAGFQERVDVEATVSRPVSEARLEVSPSLENVVSASLATADLETGKYQLSLRVHPPADAEAGDVYAGVVRLREDTARVGSSSLAQPLPVRIEVIEIDELVSFSQVTKPSPDRLVPVPGGALVSDEALMMLDAPGDASLVAREIAERHEGRVVGAAPQAKLFQLQLDESVDRAELEERIDQLNDDPDVAVAGHRTFAGVPDVVTPDDPRWDDWDDFSSDANNWHLKEVGAPVAWDLQSRASNVGVAVLDLDFDPDHEDLTFTQLELGEGLKQDGHGTRVAGVLCADGDNGIGISGVAWDCDLRGFEVFSEVTGDGYELTVDRAQEVAAWKEAIDAGARVVNMSYGSKICYRDVEGDPLAQLHIENAARELAAYIRHIDPHQQVLWVQSAGNDGCEASWRPRTLLGHDDLLSDVFVSVAATDQSGSLSPWSNFGNIVTLAAPGTDIYSTRPQQSCAWWETICSDPYGASDGTSFAAPIVSGTAALMFSHNPRVSAPDVRDCLLQGASVGRTIDGHDFDELNMVAALRCAGNIADSPPEPTDPVPGDLAAWGWNGWGQLGNGTRNESASPVAVDTSNFPTGASISHVGASGDNGCALVDQVPYCWGNAWEGKLGNGWDWMSGEDPEYSATPVPVDTSGVLDGKLITDLSVGLGHSCVVADGEAFCWGVNRHGQLGDGTYSNNKVPVAVDTSEALAGKTVTAISAGNNLTCAVADGNPYCWGQTSSSFEDDTGGLGDGFTEDSNLPVAVDTSGVLAGKVTTGVAAGWKYACATANASVYCWGSGSWGRLGIGDHGAAPTPVPVESTDDFANESVTSLSTGHRHACAVEDGSIYCWGSNALGQMGIGTTSYSALPVVVGDPPTSDGAVATAISAGNDYSCGIFDGMGFCWGDNRYGNLGDGTSANRHSPTSVDSSGFLADKTLRFISAGTGHSIAVVD